tara:strand:- start:35994 stop:36293 length:300 start_codon:yes stop_codon:yes gene_type:complete
LSRQTIILFVALALLALAVGVAIYHDNARWPDAGDRAGAAIGGPFTLVDEDGAAVTSESFKGRFRLMYFGYRLFQRYLTPARSPASGKKRVKKGVRPNA